jgi:hypothetical protein
MGSNNGRNGTGDPRHEVLGRLKCVTPGQNGHDWTALCPAHEDRRASLSVSVCEDGKVLLNCHAGCKVEAVVEAIGLTMADLFPDDGTTAAGPRTTRGTIVKTYDYTDERGRLLFQVVRFSPKDFRQRRPDGQGGWTWKLGDVRRVLYCLPAIIAAPTDQTIFVVEGEKDADRLAEENQLATTCPGGAGKWRPEYGEVLAGRHVVILPDNDDPGRLHAAQVSQALLGVAASVRIVELPNLPAKGDVSDWLESGGTASDLWTLIENTPALTAEEPPETLALVEGPPEPDGATAAEGTAPGEGEAEPSNMAHAVILAWFRHHYRPIFRRGEAIYSEALRRDVKRAEAVNTPDTRIIVRLASVSNAPRDKNGKVQVNRLPGFFATWAKVAWGDLMGELPDEEDAAEVGPSAEAEFRERVAKGLLSLITLGEVIYQEGKQATRTERRPVLHFCLKFAREGPWKSVRDHAVWCRVAPGPDGNGRLQVALRVELFAQINYRPLADMGQNAFTRLSENYLVGTADRATGKRAVRLTDEFLSSLLPDLNQNPEPTETQAEQEDSGQCQ